MEFQPSPFFSEQLTAFELWLEHGSKDKKPPEQLPIVLQVRDNIQAAHSTDQQHEMAWLICLLALAAAYVLHSDRLQYSIRIWQHYCGTCRCC